MGSYRAKYDPSAPVGVPAHITINYPFVPATAGSMHQSKLRELFGRFPEFDFVLERIMRWPDVLYLAPEPADRFTALIEAVSASFPDSPPYGGAFAQVIPHLTIAQLDDIKLLAEVEADFQVSAVGKLPVRSHAERVWLISNRSGYWETVQSFSLGD